MDTEAAIVELRPMVPEDAEALAELTRQLGYQRGASEVRDWMMGLTDRAHTQVGWVGCVGGEVAGWIEASIERRLQTPPVVLIGGLVVREGYRGTGIGRRLCEAVEGWAVECGIEAVRVTSRSTREAAHRFYRRSGYSDVKTSLVFEKRVGGV